MTRDPQPPGQGESASDAEPNGLSALYQRWRKPLVRLLQARLGTRADAEDTLQQVFVQMAASATLPEAGKEKAYLSRAAGNAAVDGWRKRGRTHAIQTVSLDAAGAEPASLATGDEHDPALRAQHRQRLARLAHALSELPERQRQAFTLNVIDGLTQHEAAARMGISLRMVSKHVSRAYAYCELRLQYGSLAQMQRLRAVDDHDHDHDPCRPGPLSDTHCHPACGSEP